MNNFEKIKNLTLDEMAEFFINRSACDNCTCDMEANSCMAVGCLDGIKQWLQAENEG